MENSSSFIKPNNLAKFWWYPRCWYETDMWN